MVKQDIVDIRRIATHPHASSVSCLYCLNYPDAELIATASTAAAAEAIGRGEFDAAIAAPVAAAHYGLRVIADNIGDIVVAITRFVLVSKPSTSPKATGLDRTSLAIFIGIDHAGALLDILTEFAMRNVNLTFIQSRPTGLELGHYHFIIDAEGHISDAHCKGDGEALRSS